MQREHAEVTACYCMSSSNLLQVANNIGQYVELKGAPMELMAQLTAPGHAFAVNADTVQALGELRKVFELLNDMGALLAPCSASKHDWPAPRVPC